MIIAVLMWLYTNAVLTPQSRLALLNPGVERAYGTPNGAVDAVLMLDNKEDLELLGNYGVTIYAVAGEMATVRIPLSRIAEIERNIPCTISFARRLRVENDSSRICSRHFTSYAPGKSPFTGKGVIYGTLDLGVDFNHPEFVDASGNTRFLKVYLPDDNTGIPPTIDGETLPGSEYGAADVPTLTADTIDYSHGTHTISTAVGSFFGNNYYGYAPEADIVAVASRNLTDVNVLNSIAYVFDEARRLNRPAVVSLSLSSYLGPHNENDICARFIDRMAGEGRLVFLAAGNTGHNNLHISHTFGREDTLRTLVCDNRWREDFATAIDVWGDSDKPLSVTIAIVDASGKPLYRAVVDDTSPELALDSACDAALASLFGGRISAVASPVEGQYEVYIEIEGALTDFNNTYVALWVNAAESERVNVWSDSNSVFRYLYLDGYTPGTPQGSISSMACGEKSISVGAYNSRIYCSNILGDDRYSLVSYDANPEAISYFSSYGPDARGVSRPDICAPGRMVISGFSSYDSRAFSPDGAMRKMVVEERIADGRTNLWGVDQGTSMATPAVAGIVATWLQAYPQLTPAMVKEILASTAVRDAFVDANPERWGYGKIDSAAGLEKVLSLASTMGVEIHNAIRYDSADKSLLNAGGMVRVYSVSGMMCAESDAATIPVGNLLPGVYLAVARGDALKFVVNR